MKFAELNESSEFEHYEIMDTYLSEIKEDNNNFNEGIMGCNMGNKIITAFKDNHYDLLKAKKNGDYEEELICSGFEQAMCYVLSLYGITYDEALAKRKSELSKSN